jgi:hypothetical protein
LQDVRPVHAGVGDLDQHLARADFRHRAILEYQHIRRTAVAVIDVFHLAVNE